MTVIILDCHLASALAAVRSLGRKSVRVVCASDRNTALSRCSRFCSAFFRYRAPGASQPLFIADLNKYLKNIREGSALILSFSDETSLALSRNRGIIDEKAVLLMPSSDNMEAAFDKGAILRIAEPLGISIPKTVFNWRTEDDLKSQLEYFDYPIVIKPRHSFSWINGKGTLLTAHYAKDYPELKEAIDKICSLTGEQPLIQEKISGDEYGINMLVNRGEPAAVFCHHRINSLSPSGGASCLRESVILPDAIVKQSKELLKKLNWHGVAMVELKQDKETGRFKLMEINGRFWGSLALAINAGVDFPYLAYQLAAGQSVNCFHNYRVGVKSRNLLGDINRLLRIIFRNNHDFNKLKETNDFFKIFFSKNIFYDVESITDPLPFFMLLADIINKKMFYGR